MAKNAATEQELAALHGVLARHMADLFKSKDPIPPATLNIVRQFLKDNGIDCQGAVNPDIEGIVKALPDFEDENEEERIVN